MAKASNGNEHALITACSSTRVEEPVVCVKNMPKGLTLDEAFKWWAEQLALHPASTTPREQYRGVGFNTLIRIQEILPLAVRIVTGGMGLLSLDEAIVPYDFSASKKEEHNIHQHLKEPFVASVWWERINTLRYGERHHVADLVRRTPGLTVISANKLFVRYMAADILSLSDEERKKVRILLAESSIGSVPVQLRPMIIPFSRTAVAHVPGNRNDMNHRAAQIFFQKIKEDPAFANLPKDEQAPLLAGDKTLKGNASTSPEYVRQVLTDHPGLLELPLEVAYAKARRDHSIGGGKMFFAGVYRTMKGIKVEAESCEGDEAALQLMRGMAFVSSPTIVKPDTEENALRQVAKFCSALKAVAPEATFSSKNISEWAKGYYNGDTDPLVSSPMKLVYLLKANTGVLPIKEVAPNTFQLTPEEE